MSNINLNVDVGQTKTLTFNTKDKYNSEDIVFNIAANDTLADWVRAANKPTYTWNEINDKPNFATVATSGSYNDLTNKPTLSTFGITATATELNYTDGVTSNIQTQLNNKVTTNSDATLKSLKIKGTLNSSAIIGSDTANNLFVKTNSDGSAEFVIYPTVVRPGISNTNAIDLGNTDSYWKSVRAGKYIVHGGTSSQFLKADGSVDSTSYQSVISDLDTIRTNATNGNTAYDWGNHANAGYATLDSNGKVPTSQLPSYVDDVVEYINKLSFPLTGEKGKIYVDATENDIYRWSGNTYIKISGIIGAQGEKGAQGYQGLQGYQGIQGKNGTNGTNGVQGVQGITGPQGPSRFDSSIITVTPPSSSAPYLQVRATGTVRGYKYVNLDNAINPTGLVVDIRVGSNDIEYIVLLKNNTNSEISFHNLNNFTFRYNGTTCSGLCPNDLGYFSLNRGEAVEISFIYNSEFRGIIVSFGNIYTYIE